MYNLEEASKTSFSKIIEDPSIVQKPLPIPNRFEHCFNQIFSSQSLQIEDLKPPFINQEPLYHDNTVSSLSNSTSPKHNKTTRNKHHEENIHHQYPFSPFTLMSRKKIISSIIKNIKEDYSFIITKKNKNKRKYKADDIRKKIKSRFHKTLKNVVNVRLKEAGAEKLFDFLQQSFISNISKSVNYEVMNLTLRELIEKDFSSPNDKKRRIDQTKYANNIIVLKYLDNNFDIQEKSKINLVLSMKYFELLEQYFHSEEFLKSIKKLQREKEEDDYIVEYVYRSFEYVRFYVNCMKE